MHKMRKSALILGALFLIFTGCHKVPTPGGDPNGESTFVRVKETPRTWDGNKRAGITYQLLVYSFADRDGDGWGDLGGITDKLDYIDSLGASAIWLSPVHPAMSYHGYDVLDYAQLNPVYGTMDDFTELVRVAKTKGIKIYLDYVINHTGREHWWFQKALEGPDNPYRDYFIFSDDPQKDIAAGKIPMIATEGAGGYDSGQWFPISATGNQKLKFTLDWKNAARPSVTVTPAESTPGDAFAASGADSPKYLYFGDGIMKQFTDLGGGQYELTTDFASSWGFLIRTSTTQWDKETKYGAQNASASTLAFGQPFTLYTHDNPDNVHNLLLPGATMFHSHFWTNWFADLNFGAVATAEQSPAFKAITDDAKIWLDAGVEGFRLDAVKHIYHNEHSDENPQFLNKFYGTMNEYFRQTRSHDIYMVGEVFSDYTQVAPYYKGLPALFEFSFWYRLQWALNEQTGCYFAKDMLEFEKEYAPYRKDYIRATKLSNHDEVRARTQLNGSLARTKLAAAVLLTSGGSPYVYYGEELGYIGTKTQGDVYVRSPMLWGDAYTTSYTNQIDPALSRTVGTVPGQEADTSSLLRLYRKFAKVRNTYPALATGTTTEHPVYNHNAFSMWPQIAAWYRTEGNEKLLVLHNFGKDQAVFALEDRIDHAVITQGNVYVKEEKEGYTLKMDAWSSVVFNIK